MGRRAGEAISAWYERAIVTNSIAADDLHHMESSDTDFNQQARKAITQHADDAEKDLADALAAYHQQRASERTPRT